MRDSKAAPSHARRNTYLPGASRSGGKRLVSLGHLRGSFRLQVKAASFLSLDAPERAIRMLLVRKAILDHMSSKPTVLAR